MMSQPVNGMIGQSNQMMTIRNLVSIAALMLGVGFAGTASATTFSETLTADDFLNDGYVTESTPLVFTHVFHPSDDVASIESVWIAVVVTDDLRCSSFSGCASDLIWQPETAVVSLDDVDWRDGQATFNIFWGEITAEANLQAVDDFLVVAVKSSGGDFVVNRSTMLVNYTVEGGGGSSTPSNAMPEPSAALVFVVGGVTLSRGLRRRG